MRNGMMLFAGTTEGRKIAEAFTGTSVPVDIYTATEYGRSLLPEGEHIRIHAGRLCREEMEREMERLQPRICVDATHPYAAAVTNEIRDAAEKAGIPVIRILRESPVLKKDVPVHLVSSSAEAADYLAHTEGRILLTTGSKEIESYSTNPELISRLYVRVLPLEKVIGKCISCGFSSSRIIAMQGPFSEELNYALMRDLKIRWMVTKDSGEEGGVPEKIAAALRLGIGIIMIGRPHEDEDGVCLSLAVNSLKSLFGIGDAIGCRTGECDASLARDKVSANTPETDPAAEGSDCPVQAPKKRTVTLAGIGPGGPEHMTDALKKCLQDADLVIGSPRALEAAASFIAAKRRIPEIRTTVIADILVRESEYQAAAVIFSGDITRYSGAGKLHGLLKEAGDGEMEIRTVPGISSISYFLSKLGIPEEEAVVSSIHGRDSDPVPLIRDNRYVCILIGKPDDVGEIWRRLCEFGISDVKMTVGEQLSSERERIYEYVPGVRTDALALLMCENMSPRRRKAGPGLPDSCFMRTSVPMTKREVRTLALSLLELPEDGIFYDIGSGTGSVSVEAAFLMPKGTVYAVECDEGAAELTEENARRAGCSNIRVICGEAPKTLAGLPAPDAAFIGGSRGALKDILRSILLKNRRAHIAVTCVTEETTSEVFSLRENAEDPAGLLYGKEIEITELSVTRHVPAGHYHIRKAENPVILAVIRDK